MIEKYMYINLDRRTDRRDAHEANLVDVGMDMSIVERFSAHDGQDYGTIGTMLDAMSADGFEAYAEGLRNLEWSYPRDSTGYMWSFLSVLRQIRESNTLTLVCLDHFFIRKPCTEMNALLSELGEPLNFVLFDYSENDKDYPSDAGMDRPKIVPHPTVPEFCIGIRGIRDTMFLTSSEMAGKIIDKANENPGMLIDKVVFEMRHEDIEGVYSVMDWQPYISLMCGGGDTRDRQIIDGGT